MSGISATGFELKDFATVKEEIEQALIHSFGTIDLQAPSVFAQIVAIMSEREALLWEKLQAVYYSQYPDTAQGYSLDAACALTGISRLKSTYTKVLCQLKGVNYTTIPKGSEVLVENTDRLFYLMDDITITNEKCYSITIELNHNNESVDSYVLNINNHKITATSLGLIKQINDSNIDVKAELDKDNEYIIINSASVEQSFSCFVSDNIKIIDCTNNAIFKARKKGYVVAPSFAVSVIQTPIQGWISVSNINAGILGRELESDVELRARRKDSLRLSGSGTMEAIRAKILNIKGVTSVSIVENPNALIDAQGRPAHSFEVLVIGGSDAEIAKVIWQTKPVGVLTYGNSSLVINDSCGKKHRLYFSRAVRKYVYITIKLKVAENFDLKNISLITDTLAKQINSLGVSEGLIFQSLFASIYLSAGIMNADIKIGASPVEENLPELSNNNIETEAGEVLVTDISKIKIEVA